VIFTIADKSLRVLLVKRGVPPFQGQFALPGGFIRPYESIEDAALRELHEETGVRDVFLEQLFTFGDPDRDPRGHVISVAYFALIASEKLSIVAGADAAEAAWFRTGKLPHLAFDHRQIFDYALQRLRSKLEYSTVGFQLLPKKFTLSELQSVYEAILEKRMDKRNFRRKIALLGIVKPIKEWRHTGRKPAQLFRFSAVQAERKKSD